MVAFTSFIVFLAAAPSLLAAPLGHPTHGRAHGRAHGRDVSPVHHRRSCPVESSSSTEPSVTETSSTTVHHPEPTKTSAKTSATAKPQVNALSSVWPVSVSNAKATWSVSLHFKYLNGRHDRSNHCDQYFNDYRSTSPEVSGHVALNDKSLNIYCALSFMRSDTLS